MNLQQYQRLKAVYVAVVASLPSYFDQDGLHGEVTLPLA